MARKQLVPLSNRQVLAEIKAFLSLCFHGLKHFSHLEVANYTGLSPSTICKMRKGKFSTVMHTKTYLAVGRAAGFKLEWTDKGARMSLVES